jgi:hypothetical protein
MPVETTKSYVRRRKMAPSHCAPHSFRTIATGKHHKRVMCCPKGHYRRGRCSVGMKTQSILTKRKRR